MKKKLFFKLFIFAVIGALVTVTSCKDYDDDISGLQDQIDNLATKAELTAQVNTLQAALTSAQSAASSAATKAQEALTAAQAALAKANAVGDAALTEAAVKALAKAEADAAAAKVKTETLAELNAKITALKAEIEDANEEEFEAIRAKLNASLEKIADQVEDILGLLAGAVYDVELVTSYFGNSQIPWAHAYLTFSSVIEKDNVFEENIGNAITFAKGNQVQTGSSFVIRVSPTNVIVTREMVSIQNSLGVAYDNVKVTKVEPYEGLLTRSTANGGGLWEVFVELENYDEDEFLAAAEKDGDEILYAVAVNNSAANAPTKVISSYDLGLLYFPYLPADELAFFVDDKNVGTINNRFDKSSISLDNPTTGALYDEQKWKGDPAVAKTNTNTADDTADDRTDLAAYPAVQGQPIKISLTQAMADTKVTAPSNIRGMYVTLDYQENAFDSAPSEWNAWKSYDYSGLDKVVEGTETEIIINSNTAINDYIGFRVFAVNYDGTLVDPDGKAFYVSLGKTAGTWPTVATSVTPTSITMVNSAEAAVTLSKLATSSSYTYTWTADKAEAYGTPASTPLAAAFNVQFLPATGAALFTTSTGATNATFTAPDFSAVKKIVAVPTEVSWLAYKDGKVYNGKLTIKNATGHVLTTMNVTFKKELPTTAPAGFSVKSGQLENNVWNAYLEPSTWAAASPYNITGTMSLSDLYNLPTGTAGNFITTFAASQPKTGGGHNPVEVTGGGLLSVGKAYVDNTTEHATSVVYNYGLISTESKSGTTVVDYKVNVLNFTTVYSNIYNDTYSWNWATRAELGLASTDNLPYKTEVVYGDVTPFVVLASHIYGKSTRDSKYNAFLNAPYNGSLDANVGVVTAKFITNATQQEEYFTVAHTAGTFTFTPKSGATNPLVDIPSTLVITTKDMYGNNVVINIPVTLKKR